MTLGLERRHRSLPTVDPMLTHFYGGSARPPLSDATTPIVDPATGLAYEDAAIAGPADLDAAFASAAEAFHTWREHTPAVRSRLLLRLADLIEQEAEGLVDAECRNTGKPRAAMLAEIPHIVDVVRFSAGAARVPEGLAAGEYAVGHTSVLRREPLGVIAQITPWNYPLMMATWKWAPAVAAGNTVVLKSAETTPVTPLMLAELAARVLPAGVLNVVCGGRETGQAMVAHPVPALVALTGSVRAGRAVMAAAAPTVKRLHLELGGKAPVLVFDDADLEQTVQGLLDIGFYNAGQSCTAASKVLATPGIHDELAARLAAGAAAMPVGPDGYFGALNNPDQLARVAGMVDRRGAHTAVLTGEPDGARGLLLPAHCRQRGSERRRARHRRGLRPGDHPPAGRGRGGGARGRQRHDVRPRGERLDDRPRPRDARRPHARLRRRVDQLPLGARHRDAARRLRLVRVRQRPVVVLAA